MSEKLFEKLLFVGLSNDPVTVDVTEPDAAAAAAATAANSVSLLFTCLPMVQVLHSSNF